MLCMCDGYLRGSCLHKGEVNGEKEESGSKGRGMLTTSTVLRRHHEDSALGPFFTRRDHEKGSHLTHHISCVSPRDGRLVLVYG